MVESPAESLVDLAKTRVRILMMNLAKAATDPSPESSKDLKVIQAQVLLMSLMTLDQMALNPETKVRTATMILKNSQVVEPLTDLKTLKEMTETTMENLIAALEMEG